MLDLIVLNCQPWLVMKPADVYALQRAFHQHYLVFTGPAVNRKEGETPFDALRRIVKKRWNITLKRSDVATTYSSGKHRLTAEFLQRDVNTAFHRLQVTRPNTDGEALWVEQKLNRRNRKLAWMCRVLKGKEIIDRYVFHWQSGKLRVSKGQQVENVEGEEWLRNLVPPHMGDIFESKKTK